MTFKCSYCGREFKSRHAVEEHEMIHKGERVVCGICHATFSNRDNLRRHDRTIHEPIRRLEAEQHERRLAREAERANQRAIMDQRIAGSQLYKLQTKICSDS